MGEYEVARARYGQAHDQSARLGMDIGVMRALAGLGDVALAEGDRAAALRRYRQALESTLHVQADLLVSGVDYRLDVMAGWAAALAGTDGERAVELAALARYHPTGGEEAQEKAQRLLDELRGQLAPAAFAAEERRGRSRDLEATVLDLLAEQE
jgi:hypothetical protein